MASIILVTPSDQIKEIIAKLTDPELRRRITIRASVELKDRLSGYPEAGAWNSAPGVGGKGVWYQRQFGTRYTRKDGTIGGRNTSQRLQKSWHVERQGESASIYTAVTYAPFLLDPARRVHWASGHGWIAIDQVGEEYIPRIEEIVFEEIDKGVE